MPVGRGKLTFEYIEIMAAGMRAAELGELFGIPVKPDFQIFVLGHPSDGLTEFPALSTK